MLISNYKSLRVILCVKTIKIMISENRSHNWSLIEHFVGNPELEQDG